VGEGISNLRLEPIVWRSRFGQRRPKIPSGPAVRWADFSDGAVATCHGNGLASLYGIEKIRKPA
jgi:hypothetical protein